MLALPDRETMDIGLVEIPVLFATTAVYIAIPVIVVMVALRLLGFGRKKLDIR